MSGMNWTVFFDRHGYGAYIWGAIGMCALVVLGECLALRQRRRQLLRELRQESAGQP
jgi:heme exporter protein CcmD